MVTLGVNVDHVATVRQARGIDEPDPVTAAAIAELAGAECITVHLREDRRHIQDRDVEILRKTVKTRLNLEMAATEEMIGIALKVLPDTVTLVPEKREELTTEGGLDVVHLRGTLKEQVATLRQGGMLVSLFIDPDLEQVKAAHRVGAQAIELHTGSYCESRDDASRKVELGKLETAMRAGKKLGLQINAGHGLNYVNVREVVALGGIQELNIGHSIVARAVLVGMERAVREMVALLKER
jgi:pyridoxine 5-phosphate synthase